MLKSLFILFVVGVCTNQSWFVSGHNCTEKSSSKTNACVFECIKILYDLEYCSSCDAGDKVIALNLNQTLTFLGQHESIFYDESKELVGARNCLDCTVNKTEHTLFERFIPPLDLLKFVNCKTNLVDISTTKCEKAQIDELHESLKGTLKGEHWCMQELGIQEQFLRYELDMAPNRANNEDATVNGTESSVTESFTWSTEAPTTTTVDPLHDNKKEETTEPPVENVTSDLKPTESGETTTQSTKSKPTKNKKIVEKHHYMGSLTIILIIVGVLITILIVSAFVLHKYVTRPRHMRQRRSARSNTSSTTYIFEAHQ